jgi:hypothetical protein
MLTEGSAVRMSASPGRSRGVDVELGVHAGQVVDAMGQAVEVLQVGGPAATQVEPHSAHAALPEVDDVGVGEVVRNLGDPDEPGPEPGEGVQQVVLVEPLERPGDDRAADDAQRGGARPVLRDGELLRQEPVVLVEREPAVDHVEVGVEERASSRHR